MDHILTIGERSVDIPGRRPAQGWQEFLLNPTRGDAAGDFPRDGKQFGVGHSGGHFGHFCFSFADAPDVSKPGAGGGLHHRVVVVGVVVVAIAVGGEIPVQPVKQRVCVDPGGFGRLRAEFVDDSRDSRINPERLFLRIG